MILKSTAIDFQFFCKQGVDKTNRSLTVSTFVRMFTPGRIIFASVFVVVFAAVLFWSYAKEKKVNRTHFKRSYLILAAIILFILLQFFIVKLGRHL